jgi:hypothetical protein
LEAEEEAKKTTKKENNEALVAVKLEPKELPDAAKTAKAGHQKKRPPVDPNVFVPPKRDRAGRMTKDEVEEVKHMKAAFDLARAAVAT